MAAEKFTFFISFYEALKELPPEDFKKVILAICEYAFFEKVPDLPLNLLVPFRLIKPIIDKTLKISEIRAEQGKKGGAPVGNTNASKQANSNKNKQNKQKQADKDIGIGVEKGNGVGVEGFTNNSKQPSKFNKKEPFCKPTLLEIRAYCSEEQYNISPEKFFDYYESNGWRVGKHPMKDWKAAVRTWQRNERSYAEKNKNAFNRCMTSQQSKEDMSKLEELLLDN